jgi:drug/metabolite transporter (DMT)-like permease
MKQKDIILGHATMFAANAIWGLMSPIGKDALNSPDIHPLALTGLRIIGAALLFWVGGLCLPQSIAPKEKVDRKDCVPMIVAALLITFANQMCVIFGMSMTSPVDATVMCSTTPFFTLILVWILWGEKHHWTKILGVVLGFAGMLVFILGGNTNSGMNVSNPLLGNLLCILSQVFGAVYMVKYAYLTRKYSPFTLMKWLFTISGALMLVVSGPDIAATEWSAIPTGTLLEVGYVVVFGTFIAYVLLPMGQRVLMPTSIAMYNYLQPIVAAAFSILIGVATITLPTVIGSVLIFTGVALVNRKYMA